MWDFVGRNYLEDFDFFFMGGEDLFVLPQNLRAYLKTLGSPEDLHFAGRRFDAGRAFFGQTNNRFNTGGAGYAMSRGTLRKFYNEGLGHPKCHITKKIAAEDVFVAHCLREVFGIGLTDTRDEEKRERFHHLEPGSLFTWRPPANPADWYVQYNREWGLLLGKDCCAPDSVSFHYIQPTVMRHLQALLYQCKRQ
jgi:glycoprotein-N-acetylgalactosamine 3-beta-galactosyltransferase